MTEQTATTAQDFADFDDTPGDSGVTYVPSRTGLAFHQSDALVRAEAGPVGSGKSVTCCMELFFRALRTAPIGGVRRSRWLVVRSTFAELKSTTIETWKEWLGYLGKFKFDSPIKFTCRKMLPDGTELFFEVFFLPLDRPDDVKKLRSLEITGAWLNEASLVEVNFTTDLIGRLRYPPRISTWRGIIMDTNMPTTRHWFYDLFEVQKPKGHKLFRQPGALIRTDDEYLPNPEAENIQNLPDGYEYYFRQLGGATQDKINVLVLAEYGAVFSGKPVYDGIYDDREHVSTEPLKFIPSIQLVVGMDFGLSPAAVFGQMSPNGCLNILAELSPTDSTFEEFLDDHVMPLFAERFNGAQVLVIGDPAGGNRSAMATQTVFQVMRSRGIAAVPAISNDILMRRDAVCHFLQRRDRFKMDPRCILLREGFQGGYKYRKRIGGEGYMNTPEKGPLSHSHDSLSYLALHYYKGVMRPAKKTVIGGTAPRKAFRYA